MNYICLYLMYIYDCCKSSSSSDVASNDVTVAASSIEAPFTVTSSKLRFVLTLCWIGSNSLNDTFIIEVTVALLMGLSLPDDATYHYMSS